MARKYEVVYIFDSALTEEQVNEKLEKFHGLLKTDERPDPVTSLNQWGRRTLSYAIHGKDVGYYVIAQLETAPSALVEFERIIKLDEGVIRHLVVVNEGEAPRPAGAVANRDDDDDDSGEEDE